MRRLSHPRLVAHITHTPHISCAILVPCFGSCCPPCRRSFSTRLFIRCLFCITWHWLLFKWFPLRLSPRHWLLLLGLAGLFGLSLNGCRLPYAVVIFLTCAFASALTFVVCYELLRPLPLNSAPAPAPAPAPAATAEPTASSASCFHQPGRSRCSCYCFVECKL